ncbi:MAG: hypothetical protein CMI54_00735 [Parcubacteria group bacterium]|mgnify:CR=1 FL=1|jgi:hypothetical protein|nr:hypothetical protein [Parcubacteria group bacterium]|tara:strand:+ start:1141 stop:2004 length:864 start_codon:yes stop_codon:yes gene_type:complete
MADATGQADLRAEHFERMVKGFALQAFKLKQVVMISPSSAWTETYYRETATELTGGTGSAVRGVPRLAAFPYGEVTWTKVQALIEKYGMEGVVSWEDQMTNNIDVIARTLLRVGRSVANAVDAQIYSVLEAAAGNSVAITAGNEWDSATVANRDPIQNLLDAKRELHIDNFDPDANLTYILLSPKDYANLIGNTKFVNSPTFRAADVIAKGVVGEVVGLKIIVSNVVTTDKALVCIARECGTWKQASPLRVVSDVDPGIKTTIRAYEMGVCQATTPNAIVTITNTQA